MKNKVWHYFFITLLWSWGILSILIVLGLSMEQLTSKIFFALAGIAPTSVAIIMVLKDTNIAYRKQFLERILHFNRFNGWWYVFIFLFVPITGLLAVLIHFIASGEPVVFSTLNDFITNPASLFIFIIFTLFFGPLAEEIGWRGYAIDQLDKQYHWLINCLILGLFWALWHVPMYFIEGTYQFQLLEGSHMTLVLYNIEKFSTAIIMYWIYRNTKYSILAAILYHFSQNFFGELLDLPIIVSYYQTYLQILFAVILIIVHFKGYNRRIHPYRIAYSDN